MPLPVSGMGMMMKSLGIDPEEIKVSINAFMTETKNAVSEVRASQIAIMGTQARIEAKLDLLLPIPAVTVRLEEGVYETDEKFPAEIGF